jgi:uncharacterized membrane protein YfcA
MLPITDPWFYACALPAVLIMGISKGGFGTGFGIVATPLMALAVSPTQAAAIMLPILCVMDLVGIRAYWRRWDARVMRIILPGGFLGVGLGALTFGVLSERAILLMLAALSFGFLLFRAFSAALNRLEARPPRTLPGLFWSLCSGLTSFVAHAGGPPLVVWLLPLRLDKFRYVATNTLYFAAINYLKLLPYALLGQFPAETLATSAVLLPLAPLGVWLGMKLVGRLSDRLFYGLCYGLLAVTACQLAWKGFMMG